MRAFAPAAATQVGPAGRVVAFEPQALVHQVLSANLVLNGFSHVVAVNGAAYFKDGMVRMMGKVTDGNAQGKDYKEVSEPGVAGATRHGQGQAGWVGSGC